MWATRELKTVNPCFHLEEICAVLLNSCWINALSWIAKGSNAYACCCLHFPRALVPHNKMSYNIKYIVLIYSPFSCYKCHVFLMFDGENNLPTDCRCYVNMSGIITYEYANFGQWNTWIASCQDNAFSLFRGREMEILDNRICNKRPKIDTRVIWRSGGLHPQLRSENWGTRVWACTITVAINLSCRIWKFVYFFRIVHYVTSANEYTAWNISVVIWDVVNRKEVVRLEMSGDVNGVRLRRDRIVVVLETTVHVFRWFSMVPINYPLIYVWFDSGDVILQKFIRISYKI